MKICPSCHTKVVDHAQVCPQCGNEFDQRRPQQTMMGIPAIGGDGDESSAGNETRAAEPRSTLFGLPSLKVEAHEGTESYDDASTAVATGKDLALALSKQEAKNRASDEALAAALGGAGSEKAKVNPKATAFGLPTPNFGNTASVENSVLDAWGLSEESSQEESATQVAPAGLMDLQQFGQVGGFSKAKKLKGTPVEHGTLMGMSLDEVEAADSGSVLPGDAFTQVAPSLDGLLDFKEAGDDGQDVELPTQALAGAALEGLEEKIAKDHRRRMLLKKVREARAADEGTPVQGSPTARHVMPSVAQDDSEPDSRESKRDTPTSGVFRVSKKKRKPGTERQGERALADLEDSSVLGTGTYRVAKEDGLLESSSVSIPEVEIKAPASEQPVMAAAQAPRGPRSGPAFPIQNKVKSDPAPVGASPAAQKVAPAPEPPREIARPSTGGVKFSIPTVDVDDDISIEDFEPWEPEVQLIPQQEFAPELTPSEDATQMFEPGAHASQNPAGPVAQPPQQHFTPQFSDEPAPVAQVQEQHFTPQFASEPGPIAQGQQQHFAPQFSAEPAPVAQVQGPGPQFGAQPASLEPTFGATGVAPDPSVAQPTQEKAEKSAVEKLVGLFQAVFGVLAALLLMGGGALGLSAGVPTDVLLMVLTVLPAVSGLGAVVVTFVPVSLRGRSLGFMAMGLIAAGSLVFSLVSAGAGLGVVLQLGGAATLLVAACFPLLLRFVR